MQEAPGGLSPTEAALWPPSVQREGSVGSHQATGPSGAPSGDGGGGDLLAEHLSPPVTNLLSPFLTGSCVCMSSQRKQGPLLVPPNAR